MTTAAPWSMRYFPERLRRREPNLCKLATQLLLNQPRRMPTQDIVNRLQRLASDQYNQILGDMPVDVRPMRPAPIMAQIVSLASHYANFHLAGRQVYDISPKIQGLLASADYKDIPCSMLMLPFVAIYLHFGPQPFRIKGGTFEGAFVSRYEDRFQFVFTTTPTVGWQGGNMVTHPTHYLYLSIDIANEDPDASLGEIVAKAIDQDRQRLMDAASLPEQSQQEGGVTILDRRGAGSKEDLENYELAVDSIDQVMNLVISTLIYITAYRENANSRWVEDTPEDLKQRADGAGKPKLVNQAKSKIIEGGYYKAYFVGEHSEHAIELPEDGSAHGVRPHWRTAHWRLQRYGPGLIHRKAVLIAQVLVNAAKLTPGEEAPGRVTRV